MTMYQDTSMHMDTSTCTHRIAASSDCLPSAILDFQWAHPSKHCFVLQCKYIATPCLVLFQISSGLNLANTALFGSANTQLLPPSQIISRFGFSRYIDFAMNLDITYIQMHNKNYAPRKAKTTNNLGHREYIYSETNNI